MTHNQSQIKYPLKHEVKVTTRILPHETIRNLYIFKLSNYPILQLYIWVII